MKMFVWVLLLITGLHCSALAQNYQQQSARLIQLRQEIESLSSENQELYQRNKMERDSLNQRKVELEAQLRKERLRELQLNTKVATLKKNTRRSMQTQKGDKELLIDWVQDLESWVQSSVPFRTRERLQQLDSLKQRIKENENVETIIYHLWSFTEKELRLGHENTYEVMDISLNGHIQKAEVVRLGFLQMYYRLPKGEMGYATLNDKGMFLAPATIEKEKQAIAFLMANLKNQKGEGYFELPGLNHGVKQ